MTNYNYKDTAICVNCGQVWNTGWNYCPECGCPDTMNTQMISLAPRRNRTQKKVEE